MVSSPVKLTLIAVMCLISCTLGGKIDLTLKVNARGAETVRSVLTKLEHFDLFNFFSVSQKGQIYEQFMREMAFVESKDGEEVDTTKSKGGIWNVDNHIFKATQSFNYSLLYHQICKAFCIDWQTVQYQDLAKPLYSGIAIYIYMYHLDIAGDGLPDGALDTIKAEFWLRVFKRNQKQFSVKWFLYISQLRKIEVCRINTDVVFVLDSSGSIGSSNFQLVRDYTYNFTKYLFSGDNDNRVGIILFGNSANVQVTLDYSSRNGRRALLNRIRHVSYLNQATNTPEGLCLLKTMNWRDTVSTLRLAVVITDGQSNQRSQSCSRGDVAMVSEQIHERKPQIIVSAIGVANYVLSELQQIATSNDTIDVLRSFDPDLLEQNQYYRSYSTCFKVAQDVPISQETNGTADEGSVSRLKFTGSFSEGVSIKICVAVGGVIVYGSYSTPNPGPALYDFMEELDDGLTSQCLTTHVDHNTTSKANTCTACQPRHRIRRAAEISEVTVYITIQGSTNGTQFSVNSDPGKSLIDELMGGCRGDQDLCDQDATVICYKNESVISDCECVYANILEDFPPCEEVTTAHRNTCTESDIPPCEKVTTAHTNTYTESGRNIFSREMVILLVSTAAAVCVCCLLTMAVCIGCLIRRHRKKRGQVAYAMLERVKHI